MVPERWKILLSLYRTGLDFSYALRRAGVPFELHIYEKGRHGIGLAGGYQMDVGLPEMA